MRAVIFANGELTDGPAARAALKPDDLIIAADGGAHHCQALSLTPGVVIGDFDSLSPADLAGLESAGAELIRYPVRKDQTDLELAVRYALEQRVDQILVFGGLGGRWDQTLANLLLPAHPDFWGIPIVYLDGDQRIYPIHGSGVIEGHPGDTVSLIPVGGPARGVTTRGLEYPLNGGVLPFGSTLGVSNALTTARASVTVEEGLIVCVVLRTDSNQRRKY